MEDKMDQINSLQINLKRLVNNKSVLFDKGDDVALEDVKNILNGKGVRYKIQGVYNGILLSIIEGKK